MYTTPCPNQKLHFLADQIPSMLASWDGDLRCRFANRAYKNWFGVDPARLLGTSIQGLLGPTLFTLNEPFMRGALAGEEQLFERVIPGPDGVQRHSLARYTPEMSDGGVVGFFVEVTDVTHMKAVELRLQREVAALEIRRERATAAERKASDSRKSELIQSVQSEAKAEFEADSRRRSAFLAQLARELKDALIPFGANQAGDIEKNPQLALSVSAMLSRQMKQLNELSDDLFALAGGVADVPGINRRIVDLRQVLHQATDLSASFIQEARHTLSVQISNRPLPVKADHGRLVQAFFILLNNAAKYTPGGGRISLTAAVAGDDVIVAVRDNGIGFQPGLSESIFRGFMQLAEPAESRQPGSGVGLALVRKLVEAHNGSVTATSEGSGKGSAFTVRLPIARR